IPLLVRHLVDRLGTTLRRRVETIPDDVMDTLRRHDWPGNIRELENVLQRAIILSRDGALTLGETWPPAIDTALSGAGATPPQVGRRPHPPSPRHRRVGIQ